MQHGSAKQAILILTVVLWIALAVAGAFYTAFLNYLELTVVCATMATCVTASLWVYLGLLELRTICRKQADQIEKLKSGNSDTAWPRPTAAAAPSPLLRFSSGPPHVAAGADCVHKLEIGPETAPDLANPTTNTEGYPSTLIEAVTETISAEPEPRVHEAAPLGGPMAIQRKTSTASTALTALRDQFAAYLRDGDFEAAVAAGDEITRQFPGSRAARQFEGIRPRLLTHAREMELDEAPIG